MNKQLGNKKIRIKVHTNSGWFETYLNLNVDSKTFLYEVTRLVEFYLAGEEKGEVEVFDWQDKRTSFIKCDGRVVWMLDEETPAPA